MNSQLKFGNFRGFSVFSQDKNLKCLKKTKDF